MKILQFLAQPELSYSYLGFKLGKYDITTSISIQWIHKLKWADVKLSQAMGYALDIEQVNEVLLLTIYVIVQTL